MMKEAIKIGLLGSGTVGSGVVRVLRENMEEITARVGTRLVLAKVLVRDVKKPRPYLEGVELTDRVEDILEDDEISIVVEVMGGIKPAKDYMLRALAAGKNVVTANKMSWRSMATSSSIWRRRTTPISALRRASAAAFPSSCRSSSA